MDLATALKETETWPVDEQFELVQRVWDRIVAAGWKPSLTEAQKAELDRRSAELDANPANVLSVECLRVVH